MRRQSTGSSPPRYLSDYRIIEEHLLLICSWERDTRKDLTRSAGIFGPTWVLPLEVMYYPYVDKLCCILVQIEDSQETSKLDNQEQMIRRRWKAKYNKKKWLQFLLLFISLSHKFLLFSVITFFFLFVN